MKFLISLFLLFTFFSKLNIVLAKTLFELNIHLFTKDLQGNLYFQGSTFIEPGPFQINNTICAQQSSFHVPGDSSRNYQVLELNDFMQHKDHDLFVNISSKEVYILVDTTNITNKRWYSYWNDQILNLDVSKYEEDKFLFHHLCFVNDLSSPVDTIDPSLLKIIIAIPIVAILILLTILIYCVKRSHSNTQNGNSYKVKQYNPNSFDYSISFRARKMKSQLSNNPVNKLTDL
jgi:hypothetical protein